MQLITGHIVRELFWEMHIDRCDRPGRIVKKCLIIKQFTSTTCYLYPQEHYRLH